MKLLFSHLLLLTLLNTHTAFSQARINITLKRQLDSVMILDQQYRGILTEMSDPLKRDSISRALSIPQKELESRIWKLQSEIDSSNLIFIEHVFRQYGYPGKSLVGSPSNESAWYVIQHSDKIEKYIDLIYEAGQKKELPFRLVAMMEDRYLVNQGKEQVYGTQVTCRLLKNGKNECFVWPIKDAEKVNERRKKAGFDQTVEQNAKRLGVIYRVVKLSEVKL
ncbi:DUF6624 domain-containing protein [Compostibacter hankyongensis]